MNKKRYAIVRVDYKCPVMLEEKLRVCLSGHSCYHTEKCPYQWGDTKGQLIKKVAQVIKTKTDNGIIVRYREGSISAEELAKEIVEFLGVE